VTAARLAVPLLLTLMGSAHAADWHVAPVISLGGEYNDNPWLQYQNPESVTGGTLDVALPLSAKTERTEFKAVADGRFLHYGADPLLNHTDGKLDLSIRQQNERTVESAAVGWTHDTTLTSELGTTGLTQINKRRDHYEASLSPERQLSQRDLLSFGVSGQWNRYADAVLTGLLDYGYGSAFVGYTRQISAATGIGLGIQGDKLSVPDRRSAETNDGLLRFNVSQHWSERLSLDAFVGPTLARLHTLERWGGAGQLALKYGGLRTDFSLTIGRQLGPTGLGTLTVQESAASSITHRTSEALWSVTTVSYLRSTDAVVAAGAMRYRVYYWRLDQGFRWQFAERVSLSLSASETEQAVDTAIGHADRFTATIGLTWAPRRLF
jgi:hypothetical protein